MKTAILGVFTLLFTLSGVAQNKNTQTEVKTTVTTIKDSDGEKKMVKSEVTKEVQNIELEAERPGTKNIPTVNSPVQVTTSTAVNVDGVTKVVDVDHSAYYYTSNGKKYQLKPDANGYIMYMPEGRYNALLRKTSNNNYFYVNKNKYSFGYFDADGNFILETYNSKSDRVNVEKFSLQK